MPYLKSVHFEIEKKRNFPFDIPAIKYSRNLELDKGVNIIVGDNGTGKSTLLESLAFKLNLPLISGYIGDKDGFDAARLLKDCLSFSWYREKISGFFFRAEDFSDFINSVENEKNKLKDSVRELEGEVPKHIIDQMLESQNYRLKQIRQDYGNDMQAYSHGEAYMKIFDLRIKKKGIYLLDEPEAALSPTRQIALIASISALSLQEDVQFIIATHSPILMAITNAKIFEITEDSMEVVAYEDTSHYRITKSFLNNPETYLRYFK